MLKIGPYEIHDMGFDDILIDKGDNSTCYQVIRVPGGWIYKFENSSTFVPFNNEFQVKKEGDK